MIARIIFLSTVTAAILVVVLVSIFSPGGNRSLPAGRKGDDDPYNNPNLSLSLYLQRRPNGLVLDTTSTSAATSSSAPLNPTRFRGNYGKSAFVFQHAITDRPESNSQVIGRAQGFVVSIDSPERFAASAFNVVYLSIDTPEYKGSLGIRVASNMISGGDSDKMMVVVGGTGSFQFAQGRAALVREKSGGSTSGNNENTDAIYNLKLWIKYPETNY